MTKEPRCSPEVSEIGQVGTTLSRNGPASKALCCWPDAKSPRKAAFIPFCGLLPSVRSGRSCKAEDRGTDQSGHYFRSPDTAQKRPLRRVYSGECIRRLCSIDCEEANAASNCGVGEEQEEQSEPFPSEGVAVLRKQRASRGRTGNFVKLDMKHRRYAQGKKRLKGQMLKRFLLKQKFSKHRRA